MKTSTNGLNLIKSFEGCRLIAYKPVSTEKYFTIGYGHYGSDVKENMVISQEQADRYLQQDLQKFENYVNQYCEKLNLNQNQFDALVSFTYNCGPGNLKKLIEGRTISQIADAMLQYNHAGGKELAGLTRRRKAERELFIKRDVKIIIGSARIDEKGGIAGVAGDQKQKNTPDQSGEVSMQEFYMHKKGWYVLRAKDPEIALKIAAAMKAACNNPNIGYSQNDRLGIIRWGTWADKPCNCDCGTLVRECIIEASGKDPGNFNTGNEALYLVASGLFEEKIEYTANMNLFVGDVLVTKTKGHTVIVVEGNLRNVLAKNDMVSEESSGGGKLSKLKVNVPTIRLGSKGKGVRVLQALLYIGVTGEFDKNTEDSCKYFQNKEKLVPDGICGPKTWGKILEDL